MGRKRQEKNQALVLEAFDTLQRPCHERRATEIVNPTHRRAWLEDAH